MSLQDELKATGVKLQRGEGKPIPKVANLFPKGYCSILASPPGVGKTWITLLLATQMTLGGSILNGLEIGARPRKVIIFAGEGGKELLYARIDETDWEFDENKLVIFNAMDMMMNKIPYFLNTPEGKKTFVEICNIYKPDVVWIDTLISFHTLDETKQAEMSAIYHFLNTLARTYKCAVIINHHTRKKSRRDPNGEFTQDDVIGTSAGIRIAHSVYIAAPDDIENGFVIKCVKSWDKKAPQLSCAFVTRQGLTDIAIRGVAVEKGTRRKIIEQLMEYAMHSFVQPAQVARLVGVTEATARYHLQQIAKDYPDWISQRTLFGNEGAFYMEKDITQEDITLRAFSKTGDNADLVDE